MSKFFHKAKGFTLIELLVVIAIIGILAGLLFPAIAGALIKGKATRLGSDGKQLVLMLFADNTTREQRGFELVWPGSTNQTTATDYFKFWGINGALQCSPAMVSGPGVPSCLTTNWNDLQSSQVAWKIVKDPQLRVDLPIFISKNVKDPTQSSWELDPDVKPFGDKYAVAIQLQGAMLILEPDKVTKKIESLPFPALTGLTIVSP